MMSMSNYDRWLTTDTAADAADAYAEYVLDEWEKYAAAGNLPIHACEDDHPEHAIYVAWEKLFQTVEAYHTRLIADEERSYYEDQEAQIAAIQEEEQMVVDSMKD